MHISRLYLGGALLACLAASTACAPAVAPEARIHRMGERVTVGSLVYNVFEDQWRAKLGQATEERVPKDRFFLIRLSVVNGGAADLMVPTMTLVDDSGQTFGELSNGDGVPEWAGYLRRVKPAETLPGQCCFRCRSETLSPACFRRERAEDRRCGYPAELCLGYTRYADAAVTASQ